jgi:glutaredoxin-like protein NrdH
MTDCGERGYTPRVTVYPKPGCLQCRATIRALESSGGDFTTVDLTTDAQARDFVMSLGHLQAPVVVCGTMHWGGFRPDRIAELTDGVA